MESIETDFSARVQRKYRAGQKEHGGDLWKKNIVPLLDDEVTDFNTYWPTLRKQIETLVGVGDKVLTVLEGTSYELITKTLRDALAPFHYDE